MSAGKMSAGKFAGKDASPMMCARTYAVQANGMAGTARVRAPWACPASPAVAVWSISTLGIDTDKHGRPRRTEVSPP